MQFPKYCQTRGDRIAHALWLVGQGGGFERADLARLIDAEFPQESTDTAQAIDIITETLERADPQMTGARPVARFVVAALEEAGLIRG